MQYFTAFIMRTPAVQFRTREENKEKDRMTKKTERQNDGDRQDDRKDRTTERQNSNKLRKETGKQI